MLFSSYTFLFQFLPAVVLAFAAARRHSPRAGILVLAAASLFFYGAWRPVYLLLLLASIAANFALGLLMEDPLRRRTVGTLGVALNLALLCYFKYTNFILDSVSALTGAPLPFVNVVLPLGISFFTFQQIAYLVDVMRGAKVERDIVAYTLFVSFFPHLIAGPLVHHAEMIPQFKRAAHVALGGAGGAGIAIFAAGLFKKVVIADNLAQFVSPVFAHLDAGGAVDARRGRGFRRCPTRLQIYFDFSGYSDMAIGLALMFGIRLPVNFHSPYKATSIIDFWRRWHITLSRFLRDYLYIPLGGNRLGERRRYLNLMLTMLLGGLWHGAGWNFLIWGGLHGLLSQRQSSLAEMAWRGGEGFALQSSCQCRRMGRHVRRGRDRLGILPRQDAGWSVGDVERDVRLRRREFGLRFVRHPAGDGPADSGRRRTSAGDRQSAAVVLSLAIALALPNVAELYGYREYRRAPEPSRWPAVGGRTSPGLCCRRWRSPSRCSACGSGLNFSIFNFECSARAGLVLRITRCRYISRSYMSDIVARTGEICMTSSYSQIVSSRPKPFDACLLDTLRAS